MSVESPSDHTAVMVVQVLHLAERAMNGRWPDLVEPILPPERAQWHFASLSPKGWAPKGEPWVCGSSRLAHVSRAR
jgi:hypothetical protein